MFFANTQVAHLCFKDEHVRAFHFLNTFVFDTNILSVETNLDITGLELLQTQFHMKLMH